MDKKVVVVLLSLCICLTGCAASGTAGMEVHETENYQSENNPTEGNPTENNASDNDLSEGCKAVDSPYSFKQLYMCDEQLGWVLTTGNELLYTVGGIENFSVVKRLDGISAGTDGFASASFLDGQAVYLAYFSEDDRHLAVEYPNDGGAVWKKTLLAYTDFGEACDAGSVYISFVDAQKGYLLYCSTPGAGSMTKILLETADGGASFDIAVDLTDQIAGYPQGISFHGDKGYIAVSYHGMDSYLYTSSDGGITWKDEKVTGAEDIDAGGEINYIDGYLPVFCSRDRNKGVVILKMVRINTEYRTFLTEDGGDSWNTSGEIPCDGLGGYSCVGNGDFLFWDGAGKLYEMSR